MHRERLSAGGKEGAWHCMALHPTLLPTLLPTHPPLPRQRALGALSLFSVMCGTAGWAGRRWLVLGSRVLGLP